MDEFINYALNNNIFHDIFDEDQLKTNINNMYNYFYMNKNIKDLVFVYIEDECIIFKYKDNILYYNLFDEKWNTMYYEIVNYNNKNKSELVELMINSSPNIVFTLHPFFTEKDKEVYFLNIDYIVDMTNSKIVFQDKVNNVVIDWIDGIKLYINNNTYILKKYDNFIAGFTDKETHFQLGDCCTIVYILNNGSLMIYNCGDVTSVVIINITS